MDRKLIEFDERLRIDQGFDALARGAFPALVLAFDRLRPGGRQRLLAFSQQFRVLFFVRSHSTVVPLGHGRAC
jgi:hypothetical protein